jgi:protein tyrosine/serine phosphatase
MKMMAFCNMASLQSLKYTDVSEARTTSIIKALTMEAVHAFKTSVYFNETRRRFIMLYVGKRKVCETSCNAKQSYIALFVALYKLPLRHVLLPLNSCFANKH